MDEVEVDCKAGTYPNLDEIVVEDDGPTLLLPCIICNKTFKPEVLQRHSKVCERNAHKKRKTFDSFKQRVQGTDLAEFLPYSTVQKKVPHIDKPISPKKTSSRWKENHEAFVSAIRAARGEGSDTPGGSGDSRSIIRPPDHEQCPYCERHFGRKAFDRHQEWCREQHSRQPPATASVQAKERLEARIKYRAPPIKSKRAITREKYSPLVQRKVRQVSPSSSSNFSSTTGSATSSAGSSRHTPQSQQEQSNRLSKSGNVASGRSHSKDSASGLGFNRGIAGRNSLRSSQRSAPRPSSPTKNSPGSGKLPASPILRRNSEESRRVLDKDDFTVTTGGLRKLQTRNSPVKNDFKTHEPPKTTTEKRNDQPCAPTISTPTMHIEINSKQVKDNTNNSKSAKNDLLWRQGCAKHTSLLSLLPNAPSPAVPSPVTPRGLIREKEARRNCPFRGKTNPIAVTSHVAELVVTPLCTRYGGTRNQKSPVNFHSRGFPLWGRKLNHVDHTSMTGNTDYDSGSAISLKLSSSSETPDYSSSSADSNRTYVTQSSVCFKIDNFQDIDNQKIEKSFPEPNLKLNYSHSNSSGQEVPEVLGVTNQKDQSASQEIFKTLKRPTYCDMPHAASDFSDREKLIPRKRVKTSKKSRKAYDHTHFSSPHSLPTKELRSYGQISDKRNNPLCVHHSIGLKHVDICSCQEQLTSYTGVKGRSHCTTWLDIAKCGNQSSQYICFNTHSSINQRNSQTKSPETVLSELKMTTSVSKHTTFNANIHSKVLTCHRKTDKMDVEAKKPVDKGKVHLPHLVPENKVQFHNTKDSDVITYSVHGTIATKPPLLIRNHSSVRLQPLPIRKSLRGNYQEEPYDPYASAERQMMELLRSDSACNISKKQKQKSPSPAPSISPMPSPTLSPKPSPLETSPTSAFTRYAKELESTESALQKETYFESSDKPLEPDVRSSVMDDGFPLIEGRHGKLIKVAGNQTSELPDESPAQLNQQLPVPKSTVQALQTAHAVKPQPPPRSNRRLASLPLTNNYSNELVVSGVSAMRLPLQSTQSVEAVAQDNVSYTDFDHRPKTYDLDSNSKKEMIEKDGWFSEKGILSELDSPVVMNSADGGKIEVLNLENRDDRLRRRETRESREVREITEQESDITDIDNLLEEVVRMQHSVSMLSEVDPSNSKATPMPLSNSSARSRRNRAGKMHIEDYLFPAELLERENNNFRTSADTSDGSNSVFGSTKSRKSSSKGRRLIEDMLFPQGFDLNANSDYQEDSDVVVSANALSAMSKPTEDFNSKIDSVFSHYPTSPVALTSKAPNVCDNSDSIPRPKPMSLSTHSSIRNGCNEKDTSSIPTSPMQPMNQSRQSTSSRLSADSAYSSLNRRSPVPQIRRQGSIGVQDMHRQGAESPQSTLSQSLTQSLVLSSSGSESSLPPLSSSQSMKRGSQSKHECVTPSSDIVSATTPLLPKLSKFCHQCGTKFLISVAKFCHECGAARLEIC